MLGKFRSLPVRTHVLILLALLALPSMLLIVHSGLEERAEAIREAEKDCLKLVDTLAAEQHALVAGVRQLATALASLPEVQSLNGRAAAPLFVDLLNKNPQYASISVADRSGIVRVSALSLEGRVSVADRRSFREARDTGEFSSGEYSMGRLAKRAVINFGYPVREASGKLTGVIGIALDLERTQQTFERIGLPSGASFSFLDHRGIIMMRNRKDALSEKLIGKPDTRKELFDRITGGQEEGTLQITGNDGTLRLGAYRKMRLPNESRPYLYIRVSIPLALVTSRAQTAMARRLGFLVALFGAGAILSWLMGKHFIVTPLTLLKKASERLGAGEGAVNVSGMVRGSNELGELAVAFDNMAESLVRREAALRASEERWATTLASIGDAVIASDGDGKITFMNGVAETLTGWTLGDALQRPVTEVFAVINEKTRKPVVDPVTKALKEGAVVGLANHTILLRKDGKEIPIDDSGAPIKGHDGAIVGVVLVFRDITERRQAEDALKSQFLFLETLADAIPSPLFYKDTRGVYLGCNRAFEEYVGLPREEILGRTVFEVQQADIAETYLRMDQALFDHPGQQIYETVVRHSSGAVKNTIINKATYRDGAGAVAGLIGVMVDITDRKYAEERLRESEEKYRRLFDDAVLGVFRSTPEGKPITVNPAYARMFGYASPEEVLALVSSIGTDLYADPSRRPSIVRMIEEAGGPVQVENLYRRKDGSTFVGNLHAWAARGAPGETLLEGFVEDITERKKTEEHLKTSLKDKEVLLKEVHHRVKNNMQVISSLLSMQSKYLTDPRAIDTFLTSMHRIKAMALIHDRLYRSESLSQIDLPAYINDLARSIMASYTVDKHIGLDIDVDPLAPDIDTVMPLGLLVNELLSNSLKHAFPGEMTGEISVKLKAEGEYLILTVADSGIGFPEDTDFMDTPSLGMQLVVTLSEQLDGKITLTREKGTEFRITFKAGE